jgi:ABC-type polysaccharide transport system permease subunit
MRIGTNPIISTKIDTTRKWSDWRVDLKTNWGLYLMALPAIIAILVFGYGPLSGLSLAFFDYNPVKGILNSPWVGLKHFTTAFNSQFFWTAFWNTIVIKGGQTIVGFPSAIILAVLLNEASRSIKRLVQTTSLLPYFISWVVIASIFHSLFSIGGLFNEIRLSLNLPQIDILSDPILFRWMMILQDTWKFSGFFAMIYLAAMARIDPQLYEAAMMDGANRLQKIWHITLGSIRPTINTLFILLIGYLVLGSYEQIFAQYNVSVYSTGDILETYAFRLGLAQAKYSYAIAIGFVQSIVALGLVLVTNRLAQKSDQQALF